MVSPCIYSSVYESGYISPAPSLSCLPKQWRGVALLLFQLQISPLMVFMKGLHALGFAFWSAFVSLFPSLYVRACAIHYPAIASSNQLTENVCCCMTFCRPVCLFSYLYNCTPCRHTKKCLKQKHSNSRSDKA